jgi:predicted GH43/DUF377 family glycosyl hydrolase
LSEATLFAKQFFLLFEKRMSGDLNTVIVVDDDDDDEDARLTHFDAIDTIPFELSASEEEGEGEDEDDEESKHARKLLGEKNEENSLDVDSEFGGANYPPEGWASVAVRQQMSWWRRHRRLLAWLGVGVILIILILAIVLSIETEHDDDEAAYHLNTEVTRLNSGSPLLRSALVGSSTMKFNTNNDKRGGGSFVYYASAAYFAQESNWTAGETFCKRRGDVMDAGDEDDGSSDTGWIERIDALLVSVSTASVESSHNVSAPHISLALPLVDCDDRNADAQFVANVTVMSPGAASYDERGCSAPRLTRLDNGTYVLVYVGIANDGGRAVCTASAPQPQNASSWSKHGPAFMGTAQATRGGVLLSREADSLPSLLFYADETSIRVAETLDFVAYTELSQQQDGAAAKVATSAPLLAPRPDSWDSGALTVGAPPVRLSDSHIMLLYNGFAHNSSVTSSRTGWDWSSGIGIAVLRGDAPDMVIYRSAQPLLVAELSWERCVDADVTLAPNTVAATSLKKTGDDEFVVFYHACRSSIGAFRLTVKPRGWEYKKD